MELTNEQELFIQHYVVSRESNDLSIEYVVKGLISCYIRSQRHCDRKHAAWLIKRIRPNIKLIGIESLIDIKELNILAQEKQADIQAMTKFAQQRRHEKRNDFALSANEWIAAVDYFDNECAYCGDTEHKLTYDHFIPFSKGGSFTKENLIPCCQKCNSSKSNIMFKDWYNKKDFYSVERANKVMNYLNTV